MSKKRKSKSQRKRERRLREQQQQQSSPPGLPPQQPEEEDRQPKTKHQPNGGLPPPGTPAPAAAVASSSRTAAAAAAVTSPRSLPQHQLLNQQQQHHRQNGKREGTATNGHKSSTKTGGDVRTIRTTPAVVVPSEKPKASTVAAAVMPPTFANGNKRIKTNGAAAASPPPPPPPLSLPSSRKRALAAVDFVYPKQRDGVTKPYAFADNHARASTPTTVGNGAGSGGSDRKAQQQSAQSAAPANETIDDILNGGGSNQKKKRKRKRRANSLDENRTAATAAAASPSASDGGSHVTKPSTPAQQNQHQQHQQSNSTVSEDPIVNIPTSSSGNTSSSSSTTTATTDDGHLSGYSVEDAVRDQWGCRPRANSTDFELNLPQRGLCDERKVLECHRWNPADPGLRYPYHCHSPRGFVNLGNTCFLNSTLQCLAFLPPFCQSLLSLPVPPAGAGGQQLHGTKPPKLSQGKRITLILRALFRQIHGTAKNNHHHHHHHHQQQQQQHRAIAPRDFVKTLHLLGSCGRSRNTGYKFRPGRQEDAHEFLVHLLDAMNDGELQGAGIDQDVSGWRDRLPIPRLDETTFVHRIFGGYFRNQLKCTDCGHRSNTYDPFLDLSLEVSRKSCQSIEHAVQQFTRKETLDSDNRWKCSACKKRVCAIKQLTVFRPPLSLCVQLKRFRFGGGGFGFGQFSGFGGGNRGKKISKPIAFPAQLELPLSDGRSCGYSLSGVVIHVGGCASSGHYTAFVKKPSANGTDQWFHVDDSFVETVSERSVLQQKDAYVLFYSRREVKLEFPAPPLRGSMTAEEATTFGRSRSRSRSDSLLEQQASSPSTVSSQECAVPGKEKRPPLTPNSQKGTDPRSGSNSGSSAVRESSSQPKPHTKDAVATPKKEIDVTKASSAPGEVKANAERTRPISGPEGRPDEPSKNVATSSSSDSSDDSSTSSSEGSSSSSSASTSSAVEEKGQEDSSQNIKTKARAMYQQNGIKPAPSGRARIGLDRGRGHGRVEVVIARSKAKVWRPKSTTVSGIGNDYGLLGNRRVEQWADGDSDHNEEAHNASQTDRMRLVESVVKKEQKKKRKMFVDRWDAGLDQGKEKKMKSKSDLPPPPLTPGRNDFQRLQSSLQRYTRVHGSGHKSFARARSNVQYKKQRKR